MMTRRTGNRRAGFTMIEMMVVITIILLLVGLLIPAVIKVQDSAKRAESKWVMDQATQAADTFCNQEQMGRVGSLPPPPFRLKNVYNSNDFEIEYLKRMFPNLPPPAANGTVTINLPFPDVTLVDGNQVAVFFLTGGPNLSFSGFSTNTQQPFNAPSTTVVGEVRKGPFLQLKPEMFSTDPRPGDPAFTPNGQAWLIDPYKTPYAIFIAGPKRNYLDSQKPTPQLQTFAVNGATVKPYYRGSSPVKYESPKSIQIISAGKDKMFGPGAGSSAITASGIDWLASLEAKDSMDDTGNFSPNSLGYGP